MAANWVRFSVLQTVLGFLGSGIAGALWWAHRQKVDLPCTADGGCSQVAASPQAYFSLGPWHDISVALLGFVAYLGLLTLSMAKWGADSPATARLLQRLLWAGSAAGFAYSWYLQYVAHFVIHAFCVWCFSSALVMTALFAVTTREALASRPLPTGEPLAARNSSTTHAPNP